MDRLYELRKYRGALFIEYALLLAFVVITGVVFLSGNVMPNSISKIFSSAGDTLELAAGKTSQEKLNSYMNSTIVGAAATGIGNFDIGTALNEKQQNLVNEIKAASGEAEVSVQRHYNTQNGNPIVYVHLGDSYSVADSGQRVSVTRYEYDKNTKELVSAIEGTAQLSKNGKDPNTARFDGGTFKAND